MTFDKANMCSPIGAAGTKYIFWRENTHEYKTTENGL